MSELVRHYRRYVKRVVDILEAPETETSVRDELEKIRLAAEEYCNALSPEDRLKIEREAAGKIPASVSKGKKFSADAILFALGASRLMDEYLMSFNAVPILKTELWKGLARHGITFDVWKAVTSGVSLSATR